MELDHSPGGRAINEEQASNSDSLSSDSGGSDHGENDRPNPMEPMFMRSRSMSERYFSKMEFGSLRGSIFTLSATAFTPAILIMPYLFSQTGVILGIIVLVLAGLITIWG
jgi:hypothetical protein